MEKEGKLNLLSVLILSILIFVVYAVFVLGVSIGVLPEFPLNYTNASLSRGFGDGSSMSMADFNGTDAQFRCNITINGTQIFNITNVSLYVGTSYHTAIDTASPNQTQIINSTLNQTINFTVPTTFNEGTYFWVCKVSDNASTTNLNSTLNQTFIIDRTPPFFENLTNTSNSVVSTGDAISISVGVSDSLTSINGVSLLVNLSGTADNEVNNTNSTRFASGVNTKNASRVNLTFVLPGHALNQVLNFTLRVNDSVNNINLTTPLVFVVRGDSTPPGINLTLPIKNFNQSTATAPNFKFVAFDNNQSGTITCAINLSLGGSLFTDVTSIAATNGTPQTNTTTTALSNGTYTWNVTCLDPAGNQNTSLSRTFTVDQIPPVLKFLNITNSSTFNTTAGISDSTAKGYGQSAGRSIIQGGIIYAVANWTDNLTRPLDANLQFFNETSNSWTTINTTAGDVSNNITPSVTSSDGYSNFSFVIPTGHNEFEGANVSFRIAANDTLGNVNASFANITIQINDTTKPTIAVILEGEGAANGTNISGTTPTIVWNVTDNNRLKYVAVDIDNAGPTGAGCNNFENNTIGNGKVETNRNGTLIVDSDGTCPLGNGTRVVRVTTEDTWGNTQLYIHSFSIQSGSTPNITLTSIQNITSGAFPDGQSGTNTTFNVTPYTGINFTGLDGATSKLKDFSWTSSCPANDTVSDSVSTFDAANVSFIHPFNFSGCKGTEANHTVTVTMADAVGNTQTKLFQFAVDDVGPTIAVHSPTPGERFNNTEVLVNVSALDNMNRVESIVYYLDGSVTRINHTTNGTITAAQGQNSSVWNISVNFTVGTHTIKIGVNDTLGNSRNSSVITFTQIGRIPAANLINISLSTYLDDVTSFPINVTLRLKDSSGNYQDLGTNATDSDQTYEIFLHTNSSAAKDQVNVTITEINGSGANWGKINFSLFLNRSNAPTFETQIKNNFTADIYHLVYFNTSFDEFLPDQNDYFAKILLPFNISSSNSLMQQVWYFSNISKLGTSASRTNVSQCSALSITTYTPTQTVPCWNYSGGNTLLFVPHFSDSGVGMVNDSSAPTINVTTPASANQSVSMFKPNITVSSDTISCKYAVNGSTANLTMAKSGNICLGHTERFKNLAAVAGTYNITFFATDGSNNINTYAWKFNVTDSTVPNNGVVTDSPTVTSSTVTVTGVNESVNVTVSYGTTNVSLTSRAHQTDFNITQAVSITNLAASTIYYYNVSVCDYNGNCKQNNTVFSFTTSAAAAAATTTSSGSSGGGGAVTSNVQTSKAQVWSSIPSGASVSLKVDKTDIGVTKVTVSVNTEVKNVELSVSSLKAKPVTTDAAPTVYQYLELTKKNVQDSQADKITVTFRVPKTWLDENNLASADVSLYRYKSQEWSQLTTSVVSSDATYVNYEAETPGFSFFAIGSGAPRGAADEEVPEGEDVPGEAPEEGAPTPVGTPKALEGPGKAPVGWIILAIVVVIGIIGYFVYKKKQESSV